MYRGNWENFQRHGRGELVTANGARYDCEWRDDRMTSECYSQPSVGQWWAAVWTALRKWLTSGWF